MECLMKVGVRFSIIFTLHAAFMKFSPLWMLPWALNNEVIHILWGSTSQVLHSSALPIIEEASIK